MSREKKTKRLKSDLDPDQQDILYPIKYNNQNGYKYSTLYDDDEDYPFIKLLEAINMRAIDIPLQSQFPKMDLSALYCLGITLQEYARHLSTNLLIQKRASQNLPPLHTLLTQDHQLDNVSSLIEKYKSKATKIQPIPIVETRPNIEQEMSSKVRQKKLNLNDPLRINHQQEESYYEKMLRRPEWQGVLRKNRDPEVAAQVAHIRREKNEQQVKKRKGELEKIKQQQQQQQQKELEMMKQEHLLPPTPPADIFDMASSFSSSGTSLSHKKKKLALSSSSSTSLSKKRRVRTSGF